MEGKQKIMLVEDEAIIAVFLKNRLIASGFYVYGIITTGEEAVAFADNNSPDIILMDINLAGKLDGIEAACAIISRKNIPIIFITSYPEGEIMERAMKINPVAYLKKPVEFKLIEKAIKSIQK